MDGSPVHCIYIYIYVYVCVYVYVWRSREIHVLKGYIGYYVPLVLRSQSLIRCRGNSVMECSRATGALQAADRVTCQSVPRPHAERTYKKY